MKKCFLIVFTLLNGLITYSQVEKPILKGNYALGGSIGYSVTSETTDRFDDSYNREINFSPSVGYFFFNRLVIGISPSVTLGESSSKSYQVESDLFRKYNNSSTLTSLGLAPFVKYYFKNGIFVIANIKYSKNWGEADSKSEGYTIIDSYSYDLYYETESNYSYNSLGYGLGLGYAFFINSKVSIDCSLNYQREKQVRSGDNNTRSSNSSTFLATDISRNLTKSNYYIGIGLNVFL